MTDETQDSPLEEAAPSVTIHDAPDPKRAAVVQGGVVVNVIKVADDSFDPGEGLALVLLEDASPISIGWHWDGKAFTPPPPLAAPARPADPRRDALLAAGMAEAQVDAILVALG